jgi:hypothetical protein
LIIVQAENASLNTWTGGKIDKIHTGKTSQLQTPARFCHYQHDGTYSFSISNTLALGVVLGLFMMMYPAMANIKF